MKAFILLLLIAIPLFSQKLWEIDVTGNGNLTDVREIPNSELLLFTYSTGRLEIRRSSDGSFVNQLISKPGESDGPVISSTGTLYYYRSAVDTIEFRDIITNEPVIRVSPEIEELEGNPVFDVKGFQMFELFDNNTKIIGNLIYADEDDSRNNKPNFVIYNIVTKQIEYQRPIDIKSTDYYYSITEKSYISPDERYIIETSGNYSRARMFNLQTKTYEFEFDGDVSEEQSYIAGVLENGRFQSNNLVTKGVSDMFRSYSFPDFILLENIDVWSKSHFFISSLNGFNVCNDVFICDVAERKENQTNQYYRYYVKYNYIKGEIIYSSKNYQASLDYSAVFTYDNCSKVIIDRDYDNRDGVIACYDANTLDVIPQYPESNYFSQLGQVINFSSSLFMGQTANIEIYDSIGEKVAPLYSGIISQNNYQFNLPNLPSGAYYLQCQLPNQTLNFNFMVVI